MASSETLDVSREGNNVRLEQVSSHLQELRNSELRGLVCVNRPMYWAAYIIIINNNVSWFLYFHGW